MNIRKIIREEVNGEEKDDLQWVKDVPMALPDEGILDNTVTVPISLRDFLLSRGNGKFIDIIFNDGRVIEIQIDSWDMRYDTYNSTRELVDIEELSLSNYEGEFTLQEYLDEFRMKPVPKYIYDAITSLIPSNVIQGIYVGDL
jgi:hypothetical protein